MQTDKNGIGIAHLVRNVGKRAVVVVVRPCWEKSGYADENYIISLAAKRAVKKGWKVIYVEPDEIDMGTVRTFNSHQYLHENRSHGYPGKYLCDIDSTSFVPDIEGLLLDEFMSTLYDNSHYGHYC